MADQNNTFDVLGTQQAVTPSLGSVVTTGTEKLLVVIFVVDCSKTMAGERISAVNAALQELRYKMSEVKSSNQLNLQTAVMTFTSGARWDMKLTPIDEVMFTPLSVRAGLTEYGAAFRELNNVLRRDAFMKYNGKVAAPVIIFMTDGEPSGRYDHELEELLKNGWFLGASRSAVLLGDAITHPEAREAVRKFVTNGDDDIVSAEDSTDIMNKIELATMKTLHGQPIVTKTSSNPDPFPFPAPDPNPNPDPFPFPAPDPFPFPDPDPNPSPDPFQDLGSNQNPDPDWTGSADNGSNPSDQPAPAPDNTNSDSGNSGGDPFGGSDPFADTGSSGGDDPFGGNDPF